MSLFGACFLEGWVSGFQMFIMVQIRLSLSTQVIAVFTDPEAGNIQVVHRDENTAKPWTQDLLDDIKTYLMKDNEDWRAAVPAAPVFQGGSAPAGTLLKNQPIEDSTTPYEKNGKGSQSRCDLTRLITPSTTSMILPSYFEVRDGRLYNTQADGVVTFIREPALTASDYLDLTDVPPEIQALLTLGTEEMKKVYRSTGGSAKQRAATTTFFNESPAEYSAASSHRNHVMNLKGGVSAIQRLGNLLNPDGVKLFKALGKLYQTPWRELIKGEKMECARGVNCKKKDDHTIITKNTGTWSIDLKMSRNDIVTALQELRVENKLPLVSGWKVRIWLSTDFGALLRSNNSSHLLRPSLSLEPSLPRRSSSSSWTPPRGTSASSTPSATPRWRRPRSSWRPSRIAS